jgi:hypothetical protein
MQPAFKISTSSVEGKRVGSIKFVKPEKSCRHFLSRKGNELRPGLPDCIFSDQTPKFWFIFVGLEMENLVIFYGHFGTFKTIRFFISIYYILRQFGIYFPTLVCCKKKNLATLV